MSGSLTVEFVSETGAVITRMTVFGDDGMYSLQESGRYEYELSSPDYSLKEVRGIISHSRIDHECERGSIEPGNYVGLLKLELLDKSSNQPVSSIHIDVRSTKLGYEDEYRSMLEEIADRCADFLLQLESPAEITLKADDEKNEATLAQRLYFLKGLLGGESFQAAVQRIVTMPNTKWREEFRQVDVRQSRRLGRYEMKQMASVGRRMKVPGGHPLCNVMETVPERIDVRDKRDTVDTPENRFVKHSLQLFLQTLEDLLKRFSAGAEDNYPGLQEEVDGLISDLEETLSHDVFKQVSLPDLLPLNSPVLQRREGYRQVLRAWMLFELAARLSWEGGDDVYEGGSSAIERFLKEVVAHVCNRATQREQHSYHTYRIHKDEPPDAINDVLPEADGRYRTKPAREKYVIHGWLKGPEYLAWVERAGLYNFRTDNRRGSLRLHESVAGAAYLLLHGDGDYQSGGRLFHIVSEGPRVFSREALIENEYPSGGSQPYYLVYDVRPLDDDDPLAAYDWNLSKIEGIGAGRHSPVPEKGIPLSEFMKGAKSKG